MPKTVIKIGVTCPHLVVVVIIFIFSKKIGRPKFDRFMRQHFGRRAINTLSSNHDHANVLPFHCANNVGKEWLGCTNFIKGWTQNRLELRGADIFSAVSVQMQEGRYSQNRSKK